MRVPIPCKSGVPVQCSLTPKGGWVIRAFAPRQTTTPMLPFERKASRFCMGRATVVNGRISCSARLISKRNSTTASARRSAFRLDQTQLSIAYLCAPSVLASRFLICLAIVGAADRRE